jgi:hypothetical protein
LLKEDEDRRQRLRARRVVQKRDESKLVAK